jgi:predicted ferric reductase
VRIPPLIAALAALFVFLPLLLAAPGHTGDTEWSSVLREAGRASGIVGTACLLLAGMLSVRIPGVDPWLGGLTAVWRLHHLLGAAAFVLLMAHPLLLALAAAGVSADAPLAVLWPPLADAAVWMGWGALAAMMIFLAPSFWFFGRPDYQRWKYVHLFAGPALILGLAHVIALQRALPEPWGTAYWVLAGALALAAFLYRAVFSLWLGPYRCRVGEVVPMARGVVELSFVPEGKPIRYRAGQFVYLRHFDPAVRPGYNEEHPYTLSSSPAGTQVRIGIKALGDASAAMAKLRPGSLVTLEGPYGRFFPHDIGDRGQLWIGGGIGITPFVGRARDLAARRPDCDIHLVYCANRPERAYYHEELLAIAGSVPGFSVHLHYFNDRGVLTNEYLARVCPDYTQRQVFVCGPAPMTDHVTRLMRAAGVRGSRFHTEAFDLL